MALAVLALWVVLALVQQGLVQPFGQLAALGQVAGAVVGVAGWLLEQLASRNREAAARARVEMLFMTFQCLVVSSWY